MGLKTKEIEFDPQQEAVISSSLWYPVQLCGQPSPLSSGYWEYFPGGKVMKMLHLPFTTIQC
jgi:hypothetical protein